MQRIPRATTSGLPCSTSSLPLIVVGWPCSVSSHKGRNFRNLVLARRPERTLAITGLAREITVHGARATASAAAINDKLLNVLTTEQKDEWKKVLVTPFKS